MCVGLCDQVWASFILGILVLLYCGAGVGAGVLVFAVEAAQGPHNLAVLIVTP